MFPNHDSSTIECSDNTNQSRSNHKNLWIIRCQTKANEIVATMCDGRPECRDLSDECNCEECNCDDLPAFCKDPCHEFYLMGDRYCDGMLDEAWKLINRTNCREGFNELNRHEQLMIKTGSKNGSEKNVVE